jgi:tRNA pseudouridine32 synthase/23S rRNA pseudouridine746 synthase
VQGAYYPACKDKCGPLLPFLLQHLDVAPPRRFSPAPPPALTLPIVHADRWLLAVDKPHGLLSIPGRGEDAQDSVLSRLRTRHPEAEGPLLVHRLDLDTSGLLLAALDPGTHTALQHQFLRREIEKRYIAVLEGIPRGERGTISLPLRGDPHDRPRQIHDPLHGKVAITDWELLAVEGQRARVALFPRTGRTHQLRVHAAHPRGLGVAMVGDRLYGREDARLLLHAESLTFTHPATGTRMELLRTAPF